MFKYALTLANVAISLLGSRPVSAAAPGDVVINELLDRRSELC